MHNTNTLSFLLTIIVVSHESIFYILKFNPLMHSNYFMPMFKINFHQKLKFYVMTMEGICISFISRILAIKWHIITKVDSFYTPTTRGSKNKKSSSRWYGPHLNVGLLNPLPYFSVEHYPLIFALLTIFFLKFWTMILLSCNYLVSYPIISPFTLMVVFVIFISCHKNTPKSQLNILKKMTTNPIKKFSYVMILIYIGFKFLKMSSFKKINIFFVTNKDIHSFINKFV